VPRDPFKSNIKHVSGLIREALNAKRRAIVQGTRDWMERDGFRWDKTMRTQQFSGALRRRGRKGPKEKLSSRSGEAGLKGSIGFDIRGKTLNKMVLRKYTTSPYGRIHELGGEIRAKNKLLTIPLPDAMDPSGKPKETSARKWKDTFFWQADGSGGINNKLFLVQEDDANDRFIFLYMLVRRVKIPPRLGMQEVHIQQTRERVEDLDKMLDNAMEAGN